MLSSVINLVRYLFGFDQYDYENCNFFNTSFEENPEENINLIGTITRFNSNQAIIDDTFTFSLGDYTYDFKIGDTVSFVINNSADNQVVKSVEIIKNFDDTNSEDHEIEYNKSGDNVMTGKIENRQGRICIISPGPMTINLDNIKVGFIPLKGDWIILNGTNMTNSNRIVDSCMPYEHKIIVGVITLWDKNEGIINKTIYFSKNQCETGYLPNINDKVACSIIRSQQGSWKYRAILVSLAKDNKNQKLTISGAKKYLKKNKDITISAMEIIPLILDEPKIIKVEISNRGNECYNFSNLKFSENNSIKIELLKNQLTNKIEANIIHDVSFHVLANEIGFSTINLEWMFDNLTIHNELKFLTAPKSIMSMLFENYSVKTNNCKDKDSRNLWYSKIESNRANSLIQPGPKNVTLFKLSKTFCNIGTYEIPDKIYNAVYHDRSNWKSQLSKLQLLVPCLKENLNPSNYKIRMHTLLYLEEIASLQMVSTLTTKTCFYRYNEFLMMEIPEESIYSCLLPGDKIYAQLPWDTETNVTNQGTIWKVKPTSIEVKFRQEFMNDYISGSEYIISFEISRLQYRRNHEAIDMAIQNNKTYWLFPNRINLKTEQIIPHENNVIENKPHFRDRRHFTKFKVRNWNHFDNKFVMRINIPVGVEKKINWFNSTLNKEQRDSISNILKGVARPNPYIVFGPPGTGKTITLVETVLQLRLLIPQSRLLVCAPSNSAVDLIALRLLDSGFLSKGEMIRLCGFNYATQGILPAGLLEYSAIPNSDFSDDNTWEGIKVCDRNTICDYSIVITTLSTSGTLFSMGFPSGSFTHFIIDEASQATEPNALLPIMFMNEHYGQLILFGDPRQLGPVISSRYAITYGLNESMIERLINNIPAYAKDSIGYPETCGYNPNLITKLVKNYRSVPEIVNLFSILFYDNELDSMLSSNSNEAKITEMIRTIMPQKDGKTFPILFHSVEGQELQEESCSYYNPAEVLQVVIYLNLLYEAGILPEQIGIVTPYRLQVKRIINLLEKIDVTIPKIGSVEEFQGQERSVIIVSTVRCHSNLSLDNNMGFITNSQRINVCISRAQSALILIGSAKTLSQDAIWEHLIKVCSSNGAFKK